MFLFSDFCKKIFFGVSYGKPACWYLHGFLQGVQCGKQFWNLIACDNKTFSSLIYFYFKGFKSVRALNYHFQQVHRVANKDDFCRPESFKRAPAVLHGNVS